MFYRVAEIQVHLPPLRDRREDIPLLAEHFAAQFAKENGRKQAPQFDKKLMHLFLNYTWPGNVRELSNRVRVACALSNGKIITEKDFPEMDLAALKKTTLPASAGSYSIPEESLEPGSIEKDIEILLQHEKTWQEIETILHAKALIYHDFDVIRAASQLEIGQATLYNRMRNEKIKARQSEFEGIALAYTVNLKLEDFKRSVFKKAYELAEEKPYQAARLLGVSPGMFYKWVEGN